METLKTFKGRQIKVSFAEKKPRHRKRKLDKKEDAENDDGGTMKKNSNFRGQVYPLLACKDYWEYSETLLLNQIQHCIFNVCVAWICRLLVVLLLKMHNSSRIDTLNFVFPLHVCTPNFGNRLMVSITKYYSLLEPTSPLLLLLPPTIIIYRIYITVWG